MTNSYRLRGRVVKVADFQTTDLSLIEGSWVRALLRPRTSLCETVGSFWRRLVSNTGLKPRNDG